VLQAFGLPAGASHSKGSSQPTGGGALCCAPGAAAARRSPMRRAGLSRSAGSVEDATRCADFPSAGNSHHFKENPLQQRIMSAAASEPTAKSGGSMLPPAQAAENRTEYRVPRDPVVAAYNPVRTSPASDAGSADLRTWHDQQGGASGRTLPTVPAGRLRIVVMSSQCPSQICRTVPKTKPHKQRTEMSAEVPTAGAGHSRFQLQAHWPTLNRPAGFRQPAAPGKPRPPHANGSRTRAKGAKPIPGLPDIALLTVPRAWLIPADRP